MYCMLSCCFLYWPGKASKRLFSCWHHYRPVGECCIEVSGRLCWLILLLIILPCDIGPEQPGEELLGSAVAKILQHASKVQFKNVQFLVFKCFMWKPGSVPRLNFIAQLIRLFIFSLVFVTFHFLSEAYIY